MFGATLEGWASKKSERSNAVTNRFLIFHATFSELDHDWLDFTDGSETSLTEEIGSQRKLNQTRQKVIGAEHGFFVNVPQGADVIEALHFTLHDSNGSGRQVREQTNPMDTGFPAARCDWLVGLVRKKNGGKIHAGRPSDGVVAPGTRVGVEQPVLAVTRVQFVFHFHQAVIIRGAEKAL
jgi:hypothetical protein